MNQYSNCSNCSTSNHGHRLAQHEIEYVSEQPLPGWYHTVRVWGGAVTKRSTTENATYAIAKNQNQRRNTMPELICEKGHNIAFITVQVKCPKCYMKIRNAYIKQ